MIPYKSMVMRLDSINQAAFKEVSGAEIVHYKEGDFKYWLEIFRDVDVFKDKSDEEVFAYFNERFYDLKELEKRIFFIKVNNEYVGTCMAWQKEDEGRKISVLHWLAVKKAHQHKGYARVLITHCIQCFMAFNEAEHIYLHTQPYSYRAIKLYYDFGFRLTKKDCYKGAKNENAAALTILKEYMNPLVYQNLIENMLD